MRKSNNYYKFMEYVSYGKRCDGTICKDNGVLECTSYCTVSDIEYYENTTLGVENDWLKIKNVLVNEEVIDVYYVKGERTFHIATFILDNFKTQKELKHAIHKAVDKFFINNVDIIKDTETAEAEETEESTEYEEMLDRGKTWKRYEAIANPEWHHVSLATLANIDNDMLDDKRRMYLTVRSELNKTLKNLRKCNSGLSYEKARSPLLRWITELHSNKIITANLKRYVFIQISMCNVECGVWASAVEVATGRHESRKYNRPTLRY